MHAGHHETCITWALYKHLYSLFILVLLPTLLVLLSFSGFFSTADPDNANQHTDRQSFTYTLMGNTAGLPFVIDGNALNSTRSLNYEPQSSWGITVRSTDSGDPQLSFVKNFRISVDGKLNQSNDRDLFALLELIV